MAPPAAAVSAGREGRLRPPFFMRFPGARGRAGSVAAAARRQPDAGRDRRVQVGGRAGAAPAQRSPQHAGGRGVSGADLDVQDLERRAPRCGGCAGMAPPVETAGWRQNERSGAELKQVRRWQPVPEFQWRICIRQPEGERHRGRCARRAVQRGDGARRRPGRRRAGDRHAAANDAARGGGRRAVAGSTTGHAALRGWAIGVETTTRRRLRAHHPHQRCRQPGREPPHRRAWRAASPALTSQRPERVQLLKLTWMPETLVVITARDPKPPPGAISMQSDSVDTSAPALLFKRVFEQT